LLIDFHMHSTASDGQLAPQELLDRAESAGIGAVAITDHDTIAGFLGARGSHQGAVRLLPGVELSCVWSGVTIHVVGLGFDPEAAPLLEFLADLAEARVARGVKIGQRLEKRGMPGGFEGAVALAGESQLGRPHFAQWMVESGHVPDIGTAFRKFLGQGKVGDVKAYWPDLGAAVEALTQSGGVAVLAHPLKYRMTRMKLNALCTEFAAVGGAAIEVLSGHQESSETDRLRRLASAFDLEVSAGSDFHRPGNHGPELGVDVKVAGGMPAVWDRML